MMKKVVILGVAVLALAGCTENRKDRGTGADDFGDVTNVKVWRNIDDAPNIVTFCADGRAWVATLNSEDNTGRGHLLRDAETDRKCQG